MSYSVTGREEVFPEFSLFQPPRSMGYWNWSRKDRLVALAFMIAMTE
jgi:hypothetical protein